MNKEDRRQELATIYEKVKKQQRVIELFEQADRDTQDDVLKLLSGKMTQEEATARLNRRLQEQG